ncbi:MAG: magnesium and cobalt transport protein CorA [Chloroflexi bacterium RBG_16_57_11]|nr:MAG: magnesium and cobalt transport protein CorA [Chloroflexi bacterium RBG_16_57_11]
MLRMIYLSSDGKLRADLDKIDLAFALHDTAGFLWVDFEGEPKEACQPVLLNTFGFHPLAVDDALEESHVPKLDDWGEYLYIVMHAAAIQPDKFYVESLEMDIFLGRNYIVTHHDQPIESINHIWTLVQRDPHHIKDGVDHVMYLLTDDIATHYMDLVEIFDDHIDEIEAEIFDRPKRDTVEKIFAIKRRVLYMRRIVAPQRELLNRLARDDIEMIDAKDRVYFRDVYDHYVRLYDIIEGVRDLVSGTLDTYLSVTNNRMNDIMKTLTVITTLFMPISFLSGFFGMNFFQPSYPLDIWTGMPAFLISLGIFILTPVVMILWIRRRGWM